MLLTSFRRVMGPHGRQNRIPAKNPKLVKITSDFKRGRHLKAAILLMMAYYSNVPSYPESNHEARNTKRSNAGPTQNQIQNHLMLPPPLPFNYTK